MLRVHLAIGNVDFAKKLNQLKVRPWVVLRLIYYLIHQDHAVFHGKGTAIVLKERTRTAVKRKFPETEDRLPKEALEGHIPTSVLEFLREANAERSSAELSAKRARREVNIND